MSFRIDAPATCGCDPKWVDGPGGPKAECQCAEGTGHADDEQGSVVERAREDMVARHGRLNDWRR